jgi:uncharacterized coiled-coil DUF342 family protein
VINKKEDTYKSLSTKFEDIKGKMNQIFDQKADVGKIIGNIKSNLDVLIYIHKVREAGAKIEMVDTQLNAIEFKKNRLQHSSDRQRRYSSERKSKHEVPQDKMRKNRENQELWNSLKEVALKKMSSGEKLTFDEMKLIYAEESD